MCKVLVCRMEYKLVIQTSTSLATNVSLSSSLKINTKCSHFIITKYTLCTCNCMWEWCSNGAVLTAASMFVVSYLHTLSRVVTVATKSGNGCCTIDGLSSAYAG